MTVGSNRSVPGLAVAQRDAVLTLRLERPEQRNAIDDVMMAGLVEAIDLAGRDESVRAIYLTGAGEHFCGGADVIVRNAATGSRPRAGSIQRRLPSLAHRLIPLICEVQVPVVCAVKGWAVGIGLQLAAAADFTVAAADATFWAPFSARGFSPDSGATWLLPRLVGLTRARELLLLGRRLNGTEAVEWGLVHQAVPATKSTPLPWSWWIGWPLALPSRSGSRSGYSSRETRCRWTGTCETKPSLWRSRRGARTFVKGSAR